MDERIWDAAVPLLRKQRRMGRWASLDECIAEAQARDARADLVILLVRHELPLASPDRSRLFSHLVVDIMRSRNGAIYRDDTEALEALNALAEATGKVFQ